MVRHRNVWFFIVSVAFAITCMKFYSCVFLTAPIYKLLFLVAPLVMMAYCLRQLFVKSSHLLYQTMQGILVSFVVALFSAYVFWEQSMVDGYRGSCELVTLIYFFYLMKEKPSLVTAENVIWFLAVLYCVLWVYAFSRLPYFTFGYMRDDGWMDMSESRGMVRVNFTGISFLVMALFLAVNKFYTTHKKAFILVAVFFFVFIVIQLTRQIIFWSALVVAGYIFFKNKILAVSVAAVLALCMALGSSVKFSDDSLFGAMINLSEQQAEDNSAGEENIRITEYKYFFGEYSPNIVTDIIGTGPTGVKSAYKHYESNLAQFKQLYLSDVGYAMMFACTGAIGLLLYLLLFFKSAFVKMPPELDYARMFMIYMIPANIAAAFYSKADYQMCISLSVYLIVMYGTKKRKPTALKVRDFVRRSWYMVHKSKGLPA